MFSSKYLRSERFNLRHARNIFFNQKRLALITIGLVGLSIGDMEICALKGVSWNET